LEKITEICVEHLVLQVAAGAQLVQVFDSWAGELSPSSFASFSLPYLRDISTKVSNRLQRMGLEPVPLAIFAKGAWYALEDLCESGYNVISLDWLHDPAEACQVADGRVTIQGNADPGILYGGRPAITAAVKQMVESFQKGKQHWICNLGHGTLGISRWRHSYITNALHLGVTPFVDPDNLRFFCEEVHRLTK
jgi:uroporphyrinogen decarboxylase